MDNGGGDGTGSFEVKIGADAEKLCIVCIEMVVEGATKWECWEGWCIGQREGDQEQSLYACVYVLNLQWKSEGVMDNDNGDTNEE